MLSHCIAYIHYGSVYCNSMWLQEKVDARGINVARKSAFTSSNIYKYVGTTVETLQN